MGVVIVNSKDREELESKILAILTTALENNTITTDDVSPIATFVLENAKDISDQQELIEFLRELSNRWNIFTPLLVISSGELQEKAENEIGQGVLELAKSGKLEEAIQLAKSATQNTVAI